MIWSGLETSPISGAGVSPVTWSETLAGEGG
jgi:hypothetical protein